MNQDQYTNPPIILASKSPRRKQLLKQIGLEFKVLASKLPEDLNKWNRPENAAVGLAKMKALDVAKAYEKRLIRQKVAPENRTGLIIAADTVVYVEDQKLGKPADKDDAARMLRMLQGSVHDVYTGIALFDIKTGKCRTDYGVTEVKFSAMSDQDIAWYVKTGEPMGKAGAYAIQGIGAQFIPEIHGCKYNVVGLPLAKLMANMHAMGYRRQ